MSQSPEPSRRGFLIGAAAVAFGGAQVYWYVREPTARHLSVRDFGAIGDGVADDGPALRRALARAAAQPATTLTLGPGRYRVFGETGAAYALAVSGARGLRIVGDQATIVVADPAIGCLSLSDSDGCQVRGVTIDYDPPPFTETTVQALDRSSGTFDVRVVAGFPPLDAPFFSFAAPEERHPSAFGAVFDPTTRQLKADVIDHVFLTAADPLGRRAFRLRAREDLPEGLAPGDVFVYLARQNGHAMSCFRSSGTELRDVHVRAANAVAFALVQSDATRITGCTVGLERGSGRLVSSNADGVHVQGCRVGPTVEGGVFESMMDDGLNIYAPPMEVLAVPSDGDLVVAGAVPVRTGDRLEFSDPVTGRITGVRRVEVSSQEPDGSRRIRLDVPVPGLSASTEDGIPDAVFNLSASGEGYVIRGNRYGRHRGHAMRLHTGKGSVEGNRIRSTSRSAMLISNDPDWPEGPHTSDLRVKDNIVEDPGGEAGIQVEGRKLGSRIADEATQRNLRIFGNTVRNWRGSAISIGAADDVQLRDNRLILDEEAEAAVAERGVLLERVDGVVIDGLVVQASPVRPLPAAIVIAPTVAAGGTAVRIRGVRVPADTVEVRDLRAQVAPATLTTAARRRSRVEQARELASRVGSVACDRLTDPGGTAVRQA